jgi:methylated-DNA-[protein]-cysteine S-methyltransferase
MLRELSYDVFETSLGWIGAVASERGLVRTTLPEPDRNAAEDAIFPAQVEAVRQPERFDGLRESIESYFEGGPSDLGDQPLDLSDAPDFFVAAWEACRRIPAGETRPYAWLAAEAGSPGAVRAAGQAMARNRFPLLVPCHRVVRSDGSLGGFGGKVGLPLKRLLLTLEGEIPAS